MTGLRPARLLEPGPLPPIPSYDHGEDYEEIQKTDVRSP